MSTKPLSEVGPRRLASDGVVGVAAVGDVEATALKAGTAAAEAGAVVVVEEAPACFMATSSARSSWICFSSSCIRAAVSAAAVWFSAVCAWHAGMDVIDTVIPSKATRPRRTDFMKLPAFSPLWITALTPEARLATSEWTVAELFVQRPIDCSFGGYRKYFENLNL